MSEHSTQAGGERRKYYRINDVVMLRYEVLSDGHVGDSQGDGDVSNLEINTDSLLHEIDRELNQAINAIWRDHPVVAQAIGLISRKVSVLATHALNYEQQDPHSYDDARVNLSGCGIAFEGRENLAAGTRLRLSLVLQPSQMTLSILGTVVESEQRLSSASLPFWIRVDFDEDLLTQEQLIQHVVQKQSAILSESNKRDTE